MKFLDRFWSKISGLVLTVMFMMAFMAIFPAQQVNAGALSVLGVNGGRGGNIKDAGAGNENVDEIYERGWTYSLPVQIQPSNSTATQVNVSTVAGVGPASATPYYGTYRFIATVTDSNSTSACFLPTTVTAENHTASIRYLVNQQYDSGPVSAGTIIDVFGDTAPTTVRYLVGHKNF